SPAVPTTSMSDSSPSSAASALRSMAWSSASTTRIIGWTWAPAWGATLAVRPAVAPSRRARSVVVGRQRYPRLDQGAAFPAGVHAQPAAHGLEPFAHARQPVARHDRAAAPVVDDAQHHLVPLEREADLGTAGAGMALDVGGGLAHRQRKCALHARRQRAVAEALVEAVGEGDAVGLQQQLGRGQFGG